MTVESLPSETTASRLLLPAEPLEPAALRAFCAANSRSVALSIEPLYVYSQDTDPTRRVGVLSGGGSGHEPMHAGFVGRGGLDAAVPGRVFASPHNRQVYEASKHIARADGVLHIVKNYTGDRIHFGIAAERLADEGIPVERVLVDDDVATDSAETGTGRRGTGGTVIVEKILGALADRGAGLAELKAYGDRVVGDTRSLAVATGPLTSFATGLPAFEIAAGTIEYGIGIHGEPAPRTIPNDGLGPLVTSMVDEILAALPGTPRRVIAFVNGLGSATALELGAITSIVAAQLARRDITIDSALVGTYVSALDMRGFMLTLTLTDDERTELWLADSRLPGLPRLSPWMPSQDSVGSDEAAADAPLDPLLENLWTHAQAAHQRLTELDQLAGDGDFGDNLLAGIEHARRNDTGRGGVDRLARSFLDAVGGSSGPLIGLVLSAVADELVAADPSEDSALALQRGAARGLVAVSRAGGAQPGDRTMLDALVGARSGSGNDIVSVIHGMADGAAATADLIARHGRASYVGARAVGAPDAGAVGITLLLAAIAGSLDGSRAADCSAVVESLIEPSIR